MLTLILGRVCDECGACFLLAELSVGKTIQVISFLSAIMKKAGDKRDIDRRRKHVSRMQDTSQDWKKRRVLPPADATWPTCLIIAPSSVVGNWEREFETVGALASCRLYD